MAEGAAGQIGNDVDSGFEVGDTESDIGIDLFQLDFGGAGANGDANRFFFSSVVTLDCCLADHRFSLIRLRRMKERRKLLSYKGCNTFI